MTKRKKLLKDIDNTRREYIRKRDSQGEMTPCISCGAWCETSSLQVGHYYTRGNDYTTELGNDERNVNLQCVPCNYHRSGYPQGYAYNLTIKYGNNILKELEEKKRTKKYWKIKDLENLLTYYKQKLSTT